MQPYERFQKLNTEGNLWIYVLSLGKEGTVYEEDLKKMIFEKFGFLAGETLLNRILYRLKKQGYIKSEKYKGKKAYSVTEKGEKELEKMRNFCQELLQKI